MQRSKRTKYLIAFSVAIVFASSASATIFDVPSGPYPTIQSGIDAASPGDSVRVAPGIYTGNGNRDIDYGGKDIVVFSSGGAAVTTIDNNQTSRSFHFHSNETNAAVLDGFTIIRGRSGSFNGNAILVDGSSPTIKNCLIMLNTVTGLNAVVKCVNGSPVFIGCTVEDNTGDSWICVLAGGSWDQCSISGNTAPTAASISNTTFQNTSFVGNTGYGANVNTGSVFQDCEFSSNGTDGVWIDANASFDDCLFERNAFIGVWVRFGSPTLTNCTIDLNGTSGTAIAGVYLTGDSPTLTGCKIRGNHGASAGGVAIGGGGVITGNRSPVLDDCTITGNLTGGFGGGISIDAQVQGGSVTPLITGCTIASNIAARGGGIHQAGTITSGSYQTTITETIIWDNCAGLFADIQAEVGAINIDCSIIGADAGGTGLINYGANISNNDPLFCGLVSCDNAPTTSGDHTVDWCSYAIKNPCGVMIGSQPKACSGGIVSNLTKNGDMEGGFAPFGSHVVPNDWKAFSTNPAEQSFITENFVNGITLPGARSVSFLRIDSGGGSSDWTAIDQAMDFWPTPACSSLTLMLDVAVHQQSLIGGGTGVPTPFEWPATVVVDYEDTFGSMRTWRWGWYINPPGGGTPQPNETQVAQGIWTAQSFDLFSELALLKRLTNIRIGGAGLTFHSAFDNVQIRCAGCSLTATAIGDTPITPPSARIALGAATPNPFSGQSAFTVTVPGGEKVKVSIYDVRGRRVRQLSNETIPSGTAFFTWDGRNDRGTSVASGVYFYRASSNGGHATKRMVLIR